MVDAADDILLLGVRDLGLTVDSGVKSLKQLLDSDPSLVFQACSAYVRLIDPDREVSSSLPRSAAAKVSACSALAVAIRELGYRGDLGYHQLLYPNESDVRDLLMFLSKSSQQQQEQQQQERPASQKEDQGLRQRIGSALLDLCGRSKLSAISEAPIRRFVTAPLRVPHKGRALKTVPGLEAYWRDWLAPVSSQPASGTKDLAASVFESVAVSIAKAREREAEHQATLDSGLNPIQFRERRRAAIAGQVAAAFRAATSGAASAAGRSSAAAQRESLASLLQSYGKENGENAGRFSRQVQYQQEEADAKKAARELAEQRLAQRRQQVEDGRAELAAVLQREAAVLGETQGFGDKERQIEAAGHEADARIKRLQREYVVKRKTFDLLPDAENNARELRRLAEAACRKSVELATEWERHRVPLIEELRRLQDMQDEALGASRAKLLEVKGMMEEIKTTADEIRAKDERHKQLVEAIHADKSRSQQQTRAAYTRRILDIVRNVKKQKLEISKVLDDTRSLQKEINAVRDTLGRSFAVADETVFQDAKREAQKPPKQQDLSKREIYRMLMSMNESFEKLVEAIEDLGQTKAAILNLDSKTEQMRARVSSNNMDRVQEDLRNILEANATLKSRLALIEQKK